MIITDDHYEFDGPSKWAHESRTAYITAADGSVWRITSQGNGLNIHALGSQTGADEIQVRPRCSNEVNIRAGRYDADTVQT